MFTAVAVGQPAGHQAAWAPTGPGAGPGNPGSFQVSPFQAPPAPPAGSRWGEPGPPERREAPPDLAGVWPRILARLLDVLAVALLYAVAGAVVPRLQDPGPLLLLVLMVGYETVMLAAGGQTLAKMLLRLRVVRVDRAPLTLRDALVRSAVIDLIWVVPLGWPIVAAVLERHWRRQGLHDLAAGTLVVRTRPTP